MWHTSHINNLGNTIGLDSGIWRNQLQQFANYVHVNVRLQLFENFSDLKSEMGN